MSIFRSSTTWTGNCVGANQSPINLSQSIAKPCDMMCDLTFDDALLSMAHVAISDEGLMLTSSGSLGSVKFNGQGYICNAVLLNHPSHHTIENIQADAEIVAFFVNPSTGEKLNVSSLIRAGATESHFFNAFIPYAAAGSGYTQVNLGNDWGLFMMVPSPGQYYFYEGSNIIPGCESVKWVVFKTFLNMDTNNFALLTKNVSPGSRPVQPLGTREVFFNDAENLSSGPIPHSTKQFMRCKKALKPGGDVKPVQKAGLSAYKKTTSAITKWTNTQIQNNGYISILDTILFVVAVASGIYFARSATFGLFFSKLAQLFARHIRGIFSTSGPNTFHA